MTDREFIDELMSDEEKLDKIAENIVDTFLVSDYTEGCISYERLKNLVKVAYRKGRE